MRIEKVIKAGVTAAPWAARAPLLSYIKEGSRFQGQEPSCLPRMLMMSMQRELMMFAGIIGFCGIGLGCRAQNSQSRIDCRYWVDSFKKTSRVFGFQVLTVKDYDEEAQKDFSAPPPYGRPFPGCVEGDFNGDGIQDFALLLWKDTGKPREQGALPIKVRLIVMMGQKNKRFQRIEIDQWDGYIPTANFLSYIAPGLHDTTPGSPPLKLKTPGFSSEIWGKDISVINFWENNKFQVRVAGN